MSKQVDFDKTKAMVISLISQTEKNLVSRRLARIVLVAIFLVMFSGCGFFSGLSGDRVSRDGAPNKTLANCDIQDAIPKVEAKSRGGNPDTYTVRGKTYKVYQNAYGYRERGKASWYGTAFHGNPTSNGERYNMYSMTAAHKHLPLPSYVEVKNLDNNRRVIVRVNDRGPFVQGRIIDLSYAAATKLDMLKSGTARVEIAVIDPRSFDLAKFAKDNHCGRSLAQDQKDSYAAPASYSPSDVVVKAGNAVAKVPAKPATATKSVGGEGVTVFLQLATYSQQPVAEKQRVRLANELEASGHRYGLGLYEFLPENSVVPWYRMRLGPLESVEKARSLAQSPLFARFGKVFPVTEAAVNF